MRYLLEISSELLPRLDKKATPALAPVPFGVPSIGIAVCLAASHLANSQTLSHLQRASRMIIR